MLLRLLPLPVVHLAAFLLIAHTAAYSQVYNGNYTWTDGSQTATREWTLYVPEGVSDSNLTSLLIFSNGSGEDRRFMVRTPWVQAFCRAHRAAVIGFNLDVPRSGNATATSANLQNALTAAAAASGRASLINAPLLPLGMSFGGINSSVLAAQMPARVLGFAANKGVYPTDWINGAQVAQAANVPGVFLPGEDDANSVANAAQMQSHFLAWRALASNSGRVSYALDYNSGHTPDTGQSWELSAILLSESRRLRHPGTQLSATAGNLPTLNAIPFSSGWLAERAIVSTGAPSPVTSRPQFPQIAPVSGYTGSPEANAASWLPSEFSARAYQAFTSTDANDIDRSEAPRNNWLQIETPARHQQFRVGESARVAIDARRWQGSLNFTYRHFHNGSLVSSLASSAASWQTVALDAGFHAVIVEATDGTSTRAAFVTFTAEDNTGVPTNTWVGVSGTNGRNMNDPAAWTNGVPLTGNRRMSTFNAATAINTDYAANGDLRASSGSMSSDAYFYGLDYPNAPGVNRGWQMIGWRAYFLGPGGITNRDANPVTFDNENGRLRLLTSQTWSAEGGDLVFLANGTSQITLGTNGDTERGRNIYLTLHAAAGRSIQINVPLVGNGGLVKSGPGTATLDAANTFKDPIYTWDPGYQETLRVHEGTLALGANATFAETNRLFVASGNNALFDLGGRAITLAALTGGGSIALGSTGSLTLRHQFEESVQNSWSPTDWRGNISGGTSGQTALTFNGTITAVDSDSSGNTNGAPSGTATMRMGGNSTFSGTVQILSGNLSVTSSRALGAAGSGNETIVSPGAQVQLDGAGLAVPEDFTFNTANNAVALSNTSGNNTLSGILRIPTTATNTDTLILNQSPGATLTINGILTGQDYVGSGGIARAFLRGSVGSIFDIPGTIANPANGTLTLFLQKNGSTPTNPVFRLAGINTFTGSVFHLGGTLRIASNAPSGAPGALGNSTGWVTLGASWGTAASEEIAVLTDGPVTVGRTFSINNANNSANTTIGGATAHNSTFAGELRVQASRTIRLTAAAGGTVTFSNSIREDNSSTASITKIGGGTVVLSRASGNTYQGGTNVSEGTLLVTNTSGSATGTGAVSIGQGAALGGTGAISGNVSIADGGRLAFTLISAPASHDRLDVGPLSFAGASALDITATGDAPRTGTYVLLRSTATLTGPLPALSLPAGYVGSLAFSGTDLVLTLTQVPFANWAAEAGLTGNEALATADPDADGLANLLEYAFQKDPTHPTDLSDLLAHGTSGNYITLTFTPHRISGLRYLVEASSDLLDWSDRSDITDLLAPGQPYTHTDSANLANTPRRFLRLRVATE